MPRYCKCCELGQKIVKQIEADFIDGVNKNQLAKKYGVSYDSIKHHLDNHLPVKMAKGAELQSAQEGFNLMNKIDELYKWMNIIFQRNFDKEKDGMALKALAQQRHTLELLAKISYALHQNKVLEMEQEKMKYLDANIPLERLTKKEQDLYLQLNMKLLGKDVIIDLSGYTDFEDVREKVEKQNKPKKLKRIRFQPEQTTQEPDQEDEEQDDNDSKAHTGDLRFKPLVDIPPPKATHNRRAFSEIMKEQDQAQSEPPAEMRPQFFPTGNEE